MFVRPDPSRPDLHCPRCDQAVVVLWPWRGWKRAWLAWKVGLVLVLLCSPILASDYCVMLPSMMLFLAAGGPLRRFAQTAPVCRRCSLELEVPSDYEQSETSVAISRTD